jgi:hypothetical protein
VNVQQKKPVKWTRRRSENASMGIQISGSRTGSSRLAIKFLPDFFENSQLTPKTVRNGRKQAAKFALRPIQTVFFFRPQRDKSTQKKVHKP